MQKVSVIIPAFNCRRYIEETVESALNQTYPDIELIVVDDASTDKTCEILKRYGEKLTVINHKNNKGPSGARNTGIQHAGGEYVAFLDHDDIWVRDKLEKQMELFKQDDKIALVYSNGYKFDLSGKSRGFFFEGVKPHRGFIFEKLLADNFIPTSSVVIKKDVLNEVGLFKQNFLIAQDFDLYLRIAERYPVDYVDEVLFKYRILPDGFSTRKKKLAFEEAIEINRSYQKKFISGNRKILRDLRKRMAKHMFYIAMWSLENTTRIDALRWYLKCIRTGAFDYKIAVSSVFFIMPKRIAVPIAKRLMEA